MEASRRGHGGQHLLVFRLLSVTRTDSGGKVTRQEFGKPQTISPNARNTRGINICKHIGAKLGPQRGTPRPAA